jgi:hypothetical protein
VNTPEEEADGSAVVHLCLIGKRSSAMEAYKASILEVGVVNDITEDDLCFELATDRSGVMWLFWFKESAGLDWTSWGE